MSRGNFPHWCMEWGDAAVAVDTTVAEAEIGPVVALPLTGDKCVDSPTLQDHTEIPHYPPFSSICPGTSPLTL